MKLSKKVKIFSGLLSPKELCRLQKSPCCFNVALILEQMKLIIIEKEKYHAQANLLRDKLNLLMKKK